MQTYHILYLEDDRQSLSTDFDRVAEALPLHFHFAETYEEALAVMQQEPIDLFVLDIEIKGDRRTGIHLAEELRQMSAYRHTPVLFVSMHRHFSYSLLAKIRRSAFLAKPFSDKEFVTQIGVALEIPEYVERHYAQGKLLLPQGGTYIEVNPNGISYIEVSYRKLFVQLVTGECIRLNGQSGLLKNILQQIEDQRIDCLRQIYRSVIVNVNQIRSVHMEKNVGTVCLFNDEKPKPLGIQFRPNIREFCN